MPVTELLDNMIYLKIRILPNGQNGVFPFEMKFASDFIHFQKLKITMISISCSQVLDKYHPPDEFLPESYTCFSLLKLPRYSHPRVLSEKLKYAIYFCKSIDSDEYARIDLTAETGSDIDSD